MQGSSSPYFLVDTKAGKGRQFETLEAARAALRVWIELQRDAGEAVIEQPGGQWSDSRITTWISDCHDHLVRLND